MEGIDLIRQSYRFGPADERNLEALADMLLPASDRFADEFYEFLMEDPYTAGFFKTEAAIGKRKTTIKAWFKDLLTADYDNRFFLRLEKIGKVHVKIGLKGHYVNAAMNFVRSFCMRQLATSGSDRIARLELGETLQKALDINLDVMTSSYREEELKKVFLSYRVESLLIRWADRLLHGLNLILMLGLLLMALGIVALLGSDIYQAFAGDFEKGVIRVFGSLLVLWMTIELLYTQVKHLRGGEFRVVVFVELALVAFIRKVFVASIEDMEPLKFGILLGGLLVLGIILFLSGRSERQ
jgi:uncharacterized membrane protein (DUF373 family)